MERHSPVSGKRKKIALYGIFGIQNIGNEYTLEAMLYNVRQLASDAEIYAVCYDPLDTQRLHGLPACAVKCPPLSHKLPPAGNLVVKLLRGIFRRIPLELYDWIRAVRVLLGTDLMIMTGTGMLTDYCSVTFGYPYDVFKWSLAARVARCKVRFVGVGVSPIHGRLSRTFIKTALAAADYRSFRDEQSRARLRQYGFERPHDPVFPDLAFSLPLSALPAAGHRAGAGRVVGIGVMKFVDMHKRECAYYDGAYDRYLDAMCGFAIWLLEHGYSVRILEGDMRHDPPVRVDLEARLARCGLACGVVDLAAPELASPHDLLDHLSRVDFVVSPRFHNLVFGIMLGKPAISISYDPKNDALLEACGLGAYCQSIENVDLERLIGQFIDLESQADRLRIEMQRKSDEFRSLLDEQYRQVLGEVGPKSAPTPQVEPRRASVLGGSVPTVTDNFNQRDFWVKENLSYAKPNFRARKCARMIAELSKGEPCDLLDVGCGPAALRQVLGSNINYYGMDMAIHHPAPYLRELDFAHNPISFDNKRFRFVVAMGIFEYMGRYQAQKFEEIRSILDPNGTFIMSYVNFRHFRRKIYDMYNNVQSIADMRRGLERTFTVDRCFPECHHWRSKQPGKNALPALQLKMEVSVPVLSPLLAVEYFFVCSPRA